MHVNYPYASVLSFLQHKKKKKVIQRCWLKRAAGLSIQYSNSHNVSISHWLNSTDVNGIAVVDPRLIHSRKHSEPRYVILGPTYIKASQRLCLMTCRTPIRLFTAIRVEPTHPPTCHPLQKFQRKTISNRNVLNYSSGLHVSTHPRAWPYRVEEEKKVAVN